MLRIPCPLQDVHVFRSEASCAPVPLHDEQMSCLFTSTSNDFPMNNSSSVTCRSISIFGPFFSDLPPPPPPKPNLFYCCY